MAESYFGTHLCKLTTCLCWPLFQERSLVNLDRFHCTRKPTAMFAMTLFTWFLPCIDFSSKTPLGCTVLYFILTNKSNNLHLLHAAYETGLFWRLVDQLMLCRELWCDRITWIQSYTALTTSMGFILHWMHCTSSVVLLCLICLPSSTNTSCVIV